MRSLSESVATRTVVGLGRWGVCTLSFIGLSRRVAAPFGESHAGLGAELPASDEQCATSNDGRAGDDCPSSQLRDRDYRAEAGAEPSQGSALPRDLSAAHGIVYRRPNAVHGELLMTVCSSSYYEAAPTHILAQASS